MGFLPVLWLHCPFIARLSSLSARFMHLSCNMQTLS